MSTVRPRISLVRLLEDVGTTVLNPVVGDPQSMDEVASVVIHDPDDELPATSDVMVLLVGISGGERIAESVVDLAERGVAVVVARVNSDLTTAERETIEASGVVVLALSRGVTWVQLTSLLHSVLAARNEVGHIHSRGGGPAGDLFAFADAVSALLDAPITIEDRSSRVIAFSGRQEEGDGPRIETVLERQVPDRYIRILEEAGVFDRLYRSDDPVWVSAETLGTKMGRIAVSIRAGDEFLGSMWVATGAPMSDDRMRALRDSAGLIAMQMLRLRGGADAERRLRADLIATVLDGGPSAVDAMGRLGLGTGPALVMALGRRSLEGYSKAEDAAHVVRLTDALAMHLGAVHSQSAAALVNGTGYAVLSVRGNSASDAEMQAFRVASDFLDRTGASADTIIGIGRLVTRPSQLSRSKRDAEHALEVLLAGRALGSVATFSSVHVDAILLAIASESAAEGFSDLGPIEAIASHDAAHSTSFVDTLDAWLNAFGDVGDAAASLHVHPNTFRYRLSKLKGLAALDLDDPNVRFRLMVHLRLRGPR
ncbi:PucR family transcriptional regulator [Rhodococcus sp. NPDC056743]|uniref:PucR family transcriptional regulator n=1 Tax=Rhodococcus sp. NPDC056743 TaxID=3345934 RepID=UPI00366CD8D6